MRDAEQRKYLHKALWQWLSDNPMKEKYDWPGWVHRGGHYEEAPEECFACEEAREQRNKKDPSIVPACQFCPCDWSMAKNCEYGDSPYACWREARNAKDRSKYATRVKDAWK